MLLRSLGYPVNIYVLLEVLVNYPVIEYLYQMHLYYPSALENEDTQTLQADYFSK